MEYSRCRECEPACRIVAGQGPLPCQTLWIGEKPGQEEAYRGQPFVGMTGKELDNTYLPLAGYERPEIRVTNTVKCRLGGTNVKPTEEQVDACARHWLRREVLECQPELIVLMGATACSLVPKLELEKDHGYPVWVTAEDSEYLYGYEGWVWPSYHPASGLHSSSEMIPLLEDFERLKLWRRGKWTPPVDPVESTDYQVLQSKSEIAQVLALSDSPYEYLPVDTEDDAGVPWSIQFSTRPGNGYLIYAKDRHLIRFFNRCLSEWGRVCLHFAVHDLEVMEQMGIDVSRLMVRDTMQEAYQLGNLAQKLKTLGWRLLGVRMRDWEDVVKPHSHRVMRQWLLDQWDDLTEQRTRVEIRLKTKTKVTYKPLDAERDVRRILSHSHKPGYDLWLKAKEAGLDGYPKVSIAHVPEAEAVAYACQDADVTGRVSVVLAEMHRRIVAEGGEWQVEEEDRDRQESDCAAAAD